MGQALLGGRDPPVLMAGTPRDLSSHEQSGARGVGCSGETPGQLCGAEIPPFCLSLSIHFLSLCSFDFPFFRASLCFCPGLFVESATIRPSLALGWRQRGPEAAGCAFCRGGAEVLSSAAIAKGGVWGGGSILKFFFFFESSKSSWPLRCYNQCRKQLGHSFIN